MTAGGAVIRGLGALVVSVFVVVGFGYFVLTIGLRDILLDSEPLLSALDRNEAYTRIYDEALVGSRLEEQLIDLTGGYHVAAETEIAIIKRVLPPDVLKADVERNVHALVAFMNNETDDLDIYIDLQHSLAQVEPLVLEYLDERIDAARLTTPTTQAEFQRDLMTYFRDLTAGRVSATMPGLGNLDRAEALRAYSSAVNELARLSSIPPEVVANLDAREDAVADAIAGGDARLALKTTARAVAGPIIERSVASLQSRLTDEGRLDLIDRAAEDVGSREQVVADARTFRTALRLAIGVGAFLGLAFMALGLALIGLIFVPHLHHAIRWPSVSLIVTGASFALVGVLLSINAPPWRDAWCKDADAPSCQLAVDVGMSLAGRIGADFIVPAFVLLALGIAGFLASMLVERRRIVH